VSRLAAPGGAHRIDVGEASVYTDLPADGVDGGGDLLAPAKGHGAAASLRPLYEPIPKLIDPAALSAAEMQICKRQPKRGRWRHSAGVSQLLRFIDNAKCVEN
jgi:hypothetical protein